MPWSFTHRYVFASASEPPASAISPTSHGIARSFMATLLNLSSHLGRRGPSPATACGAHHEISVLDPAKEPDRRGPILRFDLLGVGDDDRPDASQLGDRVGVVVDAEVVIHAWLADGRHQERRGLLAALVASGRLPCFQRQEEAFREVPSLAAVPAERAGHRRDHVRADQHVTGDRKLVALLVTAPRNALGPGVAEGALAVEPVHLTDLSLAVLPEESAQRHIDRHTLRKERQPLPAEIGVHARLRGDRSTRRNPRHEAADVGPCRSDGDAERARLPIARRDGEGVKINHLFKLYHGGAREPARLLMIRPGLILYPRAHGRSRARRSLRGREPRRAHPRPARVIEHIGILTADEIGRIRGRALRRDAGGRLSHLRSRTRSARIRDITAETMIVGGRIVHERRRPGARRRPPAWAIAFAARADITCCPHRAPRPRARSHSPPT